LYIAGVFLIGAILVAVSIYAYENYVRKGTSDEVSQNTSEILAKVGRIMVIPKDEVPTVATVTDKSKLSGQLFFKKAENGDKLLIFASLKEAILYRPSTNQIVNVAPLNEDPGEGVLRGPDPNVSITIMPTKNSEPAKILILNGTGRKGLAASAQNKLEEEGLNVDITELGNAKSNYEQTIIVDLTGRNNSVIDELTESLGGETSELPEGEEAEGADVLIILGENFEI
jgi:hypothetical protein